MFNKFLIKGWADNICFNEKQFNSFDDAWSFIYEQFPDESDFDDYYVIEIT